jgi:Leucine-rich repeat (LRR) protein
MQPSVITQRSAVISDCIPTDVVQNTAEYVGRVAGLLSFRAVSPEWRSAVSDAVGYLNGRCWTHLENGDNDGALWTSLRLDDAAVVMRCAVLCLRPRLETLVWTPRSDDDRLPLQLLGENNATLTALNVDGSYSMHLMDLVELRACVSLRELALFNNLITNEGFAGHDGLLSQLEKLDLRGCEQLKAISKLVTCGSLRELNLSRSAVEDLRGLEYLELLETLDVTGITPSDWSILRECPSLTALAADCDGVHTSRIESDQITAAAAHCLSKYHEHCSPNGVDLSSLHRCPVLRELYLEDSVFHTRCSSIHFIKEVPALEVLHLRYSHVRDLSPLAESYSLRELSVTEASLLTDAGLVELKDMRALEALDLSCCRQVSSVVGLRHSTTLRKLVLMATGITDAGIAGLECIIGLTELSLYGCKSITSVSTLRLCPSLRKLDISNTKVTADGVKGLEEISTLERLKAWYCSELSDVATLAGCRSLRVLYLGGSKVTGPGVAALAGVKSLETLKLSHCTHLRDVHGLCASVSIRELDLSHTAVDNNDIAGLERITSLTSLTLAGCHGVRNVAALIQSKSLRRLCLAYSRMTSEDIVGIETAPTLEVLDVSECPIADARAVAERAARRFVKVVS